jgi:hypothetical protein
MREAISLAVATWMLERLTPRAYSRALSGDLLEEIYAGRTVGWYWRQVISAIATSLVSRSRGYVVPLAFSGTWSVLYPIWQQAMARDRFLQGELSRWSTLDWPYSAISAIGGAFLPAASFVWLGFFVYLFLPTRVAVAPSGPRVIGSLSLSLNVLLVAAMAQPLGLGIFGSSTSHLGLSILLALSLSTALLTACPPRPRRRHRAGYFRA